MRLRIVGIRLDAATMVVLCLTVQFAVGSLNDDYCGSISI